MKSFTHAGVTVGVQPGVFYPTETSKVILDYLLEKKKKIKSVLDLGCGCGIVGVALAQSGILKYLSASDVSVKAVKNTQLNAARHQIKIDARVSSLYDHWGKQRFNTIICDVSGVSEDLAKVSPWFGKMIPCESGKDGTSLITRIIKDTPSHLNARGTLLLAVLTLSNHKKIVKNMRRVFQKTKKVASRQFYLPKELMIYKKIIERLRRQGYIDLEEKFGLYLWRTDLYEATK